MENLPGIIGVLFVGSFPFILVFGLIAALRFGRKLQKDQYKANYRRESSWQREVDDERKGGR
ncbi:hypothetical protein [Paeniglutamicibacter sp. NPDC091659]|uniref:hypothetical protein n=1 Tax=Paeniglutamicibacter sp. NPDC091659 TaxID=3364389 RepID=UPI0037F29A6F